MNKPAVIMVTSNGVGAGHLIRASAIAREISNFARPVIFSMAYSVVEVSSALGLECEYVPSRDKGLMPKKKWDRYLRDRLIALIDETNASVITFDGVVPYPGIIGAKFARPNVNLVWVRRGMWQRKPQGILLNLQSKLMDYVIEPGDVAREADSGPTKNRQEAVITQPVTLYRTDRALSKEEAREFLGLKLNAPAVLIQLGVGSTDLDARLSAVLKGLKGWPNLQIVMPREPRDKEGKWLLPEGIEVKVVRHFPLADLLHAFDAAVCAAGYNSVHEVIPAGLPTLFIANNRGTDDQRARAKWLSDKEIALYADNESLDEITAQAGKLKFPILRQQLTKQCLATEAFTGASEIAELINILSSEKYSNLIRKRIQHQNLIFLKLVLKNPVVHIKKAINLALRMAALLFRMFFPHNSLEISRGEVVFSNSRNFKLLDKYIKSQERFEHLITLDSPDYLLRRQEIARAVYGDLDTLYEAIEIQTHLKFAS